jgi:hypothetical protein
MQKTEVLEMTSDKEAIIEHCMKSQGMTRAEAEACWERMQKGKAE